MIKILTIRYLTISLVLNNWAQVYSLIDSDAAPNYTYMFGPHMESSMELICNQHIRMKAGNDHIVGGIKNIVMTSIDVLIVCDNPLRGFKSSLNFLSFSPSFG